MNSNINKPYQSLMKRLEKHKKKDYVKNAKDSEEDITKNICVDKKTKNKTITPYPTQYISSKDNDSDRVKITRSLSMQDKRAFTTFEKIMMFISNFFTKFF